jgi:hypothetical protein
MTSSTSSPTAIRTPEEIWADDLLKRRREAELLIGYMECAYARSRKLTDCRAHTIAVDGSYGEGKTFFLKRLAEHVALSHPVAMIDAWSDDLADEPLTQSRCWKR